MNAELPHDADEATDGPLYAEDLARRALSERIAEVLEQLRNIRGRHDDPETIHQLRVWSRRAEAALDVFGPFASPRRTKWLRKKLKKVRRAAGDARDADVLAHRWAKLAGEEPASGWKKLLAKVDRERKETRRGVKKLARQYGQKDFGPRARAFLKRIRERRPGPESEESAGGAESFAHQTIAAAGKAFWKDEPVVMRNIDDLHAFRIQGKKLRYTIEACRPALPKAAVEDCLKELTAVQDRLGKINDRASALIRLEKWRDEAKHPATIGRLNGLMADEQQELNARVAGLADWWDSERRSSLREMLFVLSSPRGRRDEPEATEGQGQDVPTLPAPQRPWPVPFWYEDEEGEADPTGGEPPETEPDEAADSAASRTEDATPESPDDGAAPDASSPSEHPTEPAPDETRRD